MEDHYENIEFQVDSLILYTRLRLLFILAPGMCAVSNTTYEVLIKPDNGNHTEVDRIVIRGGTEEEIGYELGKIGIEKFNAILVPYDNPIYGKAKEEYIRLHDSVLYERIKGIKRAYGLKADNYSRDPSVLLYILSFPSCSAIYFPPNSTENGHALGGKTWNGSSIQRMITLPRILLLATICPSSATGSGHGIMSLSCTQITDMQH